MSRLKTFLWSNLGHCPTCMRVSFLVAAASLAPLAISLIVFPPAAWLLGPTSVLAWLVWIAHILVYGWKSALAASLHPPKLQDRQRRRLLRGLAEGVLFAAAGSALPAAAQNEYWCGENPYADIRTGIGSCGQFDLPLRFSSTRS